MTEPDFDQIKCFDCNQEIRDRVVWLGEDHGGRGRVVYAFHRDCSLGAWPLFELEDAQAREWIHDGAHTNAEILNENGTLAQAGDTESRS